MHNVTASTAVPLLLGALITFSAAAQGQTPCSGGEKARQFDFWIGEWEVTAAGQKAGVNSIQPILGGCVLQENWSGSSGSQGSSFNFYNPQKDKWQQFWVWRNGTTLELEGGFADGKMTLEGQSLTRQGEKRLNRITWEAMPEGRVRQLWETSADGGQTWTSAFDGLYIRKSDSEAENPR